MISDPFLQFSEAFLHQEVEVAGERYWAHRILGYRLRPYALWHLLYLRSVQHPLLEAGAWVDLHSFRNALRICTSKFGGSVVRPPLLDRLRELAYLGLAAHQLRTQRASSLLLHAHQQFATYQRDYVSLPVFARRAPKKGEQEHKAQCDWVLSRVARLMRAGMTEQQAWMCPVGVSAWYAVAHAENAGAKFRILTPEVAAALQQARAARTISPES